MVDDVQKRRTSNKRHLEKKSTKAVRSFPELRRTRACQTAIEQRGNDHYLLQAQSPLPYNQATITTTATTAANYQRKTHLLLPLLLPSQRERARALTIPPGTCKCAPNPLPVELCVVCAIACACDPSALRVRACVCVSVDSLMVKIV